MPRSIFIASSKGFIAVFSVFYGSSLLALLLAAWPWWVRLACAVPLLLDYWQIVLLHGLRTHKQSVAAVTQDCDKWRVQLFSGKEYKGHISKQKCYCSPLVLIVHISDQYQAKYVIIPRDSLSTRNYRFLAQQINHTITTNAIGRNA